MSEELLIRYASPTLAGLKTGSLFTCKYDSAEEMHRELRTWNLRFRAKGLRLLALRSERGSALLYLFRPRRLARDFQDPRTQKLLRSFGYPVGSPDRCVVLLAKKLQRQTEFPHEIGLFLSYPSEDVAGFIENKARNFKCVGCWKVYGDESNARETFARYEKCTSVYTSCYAGGTSLDRLAVAG